MFSNALPLTPRLSPHQVDDEVDAIAQMEDQEFVELLALAADQEDPVMHTHMEDQDIPSSPTRYGSDEEDYEDIFMEMASSQGALGTHDQFQSMQQHEVHVLHASEDVEMDMSI
jgi:hypothetical protein